MPTFCVNKEHTNYGRHEIHNTKVCQNMPYLANQHPLCGKNWVSAQLEADRYYPPTSWCACYNCKESWPNKLEKDRLTKNLTLKIVEYLRGKGIWG